MNLKFKIKYSNKIILGLIFAAGLGVRLYKLNAPLADWHSFRQADTASVARYFVEDGFDLFRPKYHDLSSIQSGQPNPEGYRMVEFPLYNALHGLTYLFLNYFPITVGFETAGRLISIAASLVSAYFLFLIVNQKLNWLTGVFAAGFFLLLPFNIFYSRTILPDNLMIALSLAGIFYFINDKFFPGVILGGLALLTKPYSIFLIFPILVFSFIKHVSLKNLVRLAVSGLLIVSPLIAWRLSIQQFPEGIPANQWLLNQGNIRLRPAWWRWLFFERLGKLILGGWGLILFGLGLISQVTKKFDWLSYFLLAGIFGYFVIFAWGNVQHDYYQIIAVPVTAIFLAKGAYFLTKPTNNINKYLSYLLLIVCCLFAFGFAWFQVSEFYKINHPEIVAAGESADRLLPKGTKVIAPYEGDTAFLYQTKRSGWPALTGSVDQLIERGAEYYVGVNYDRTTIRLKNECEVIEETENWIIINLTECNNEAETE